MMKRILQIVLLGLVTGPAPLVAVQVPQNSAADYIFTAPRLTNHIHGVLIDTATNGYRVIRSEDVDWLNEAVAERAHIVGGRLPETNRISAGVGPVVKSEDVPRYIFTSGWLDGDAPLLENCRFFDGDRAFTNVYRQTHYTNAVSNAYSVIEMPMTNGTTSVYTNSWAVEKHRYYTQTYTNITRSLVDWCHGVDGEPFPTYTNDEQLAVFDRKYKTSIPTVRYFDAVREALRGTVRLADESLMFTNATYTIYEYQEDGGGHGIRTNFIGGAYYNFYANSWIAEREQMPPFIASIPTRFDSSLVTTGGVSRVAVEAAYATGWFSYSHTTEHTHSISKQAIVRLAGPSLDLSGNKACCRVSLNTHAMCSTCASTAGVPVPPIALSYREPENSSSSWSFSIDTFVIFYRITPSTKLPDW